jgi:hypothetical protein
MKVHCGMVHKNLGMLLDFSHKGQCRVSKYDYVDGILEAFDDAVKKYDDGISKLESAAPSLVQPPTISSLWTKIARNYRMM